MSKHTKKPEDLRSARWFAPDDLRSFGHRSRMNQMGYDVSEFAGKPIIGIINTWSDFAQCHSHFKQRVEDVKRGVLMAGGFPVGTATAETGPMLFAMNAGMYHDNLDPVGLYIEKGETLKQANTHAGPGNFHMRPNGVFYVTAGRTLGVMETRKFVAARIKPEFASQSGPMLVIGGKLHPAFTGRGQSKKIRNGVGVAPGGKTAWFVISEEPVTFTDFANIFRDLKAQDALYFDGSISSLYAPSVNRADRFMPVGPIVGVYAK